MFTHLIHKYLHVNVTDNKSKYADMVQVHLYKFSIVVPDVDTTR